MRECAFKEQELWVIVFEEGENTTKFVGGFFSGAPHLVAVHSYQLYAGYWESLSKGAHSAGRNLGAHMNDFSTEDTH